MVRAILDGRKTQTRRITKTQPSVVSNDDAAWRDGMNDLWRNSRQYARDCCPYGSVGDRLWVRESLEWRRNEGQYTHGIQHPDEPPDLIYCADGKIIEKIPDGYEPTRKTISSIHMPRWASRITLEITDLRVQRLHEIGKDGRKAVDVLAEGVLQAHIERNREFFHVDDAPAMTFAYLWNGIHYKPGTVWKDNPFVYTISFKVVK